MAAKSANVSVRQADGGQQTHPLLNLRQEIDRMFDEFGRGWPAFGRYEITAELPGIDEKDIEVTPSRDSLTLKAEKRVEREEKKKNYHLSERSYGTFQRTFMLPADADRVESHFRKGVLTITLPKSAEAKASVRRIDVKAS